MGANERPSCHAGLDIRRPLRVAVLDRPGASSRIEELELAEGQIVWLRLEAEPVSV